VPLAVEIVTPSRILVQEQVDELNIPGELGYLGILPGHTALLTNLGRGELMYRQGEQRRSEDRAIRKRIEEVGRMAREVLLKE